MPGKWVEVVRLGFLGKRFEDHAIDVTALSEIAKFQQIVAVTAKELWKAANPNRMNLPPRFDERTRLYLRQVVPGSAFAPLEVLLEEDPNRLVPSVPKDLADGIDLAYEVFEATDRSTPLPERLPRYLVAEYAALGQCLSQDEALSIQPANKAPVRFDSRHRTRLARFIEKPYVASARVEGEVLEADVRQRRFQLWLPDRTAVTVSFTEEQEETVTTALKEHASLRIRASGQAEHSQQGKIQKFIHLDRLDMVQPGPTLFDVRGPAIEDELARLAADIPEEEWKRLPDDLTDNLDHYIYGTPRQ